MEKELIYGWVFNPTNSLFKRKATEKACKISIMCSNKDNCELYKRGECTYCGMYGRCPYGAKYYKDGFSKKARKFYTWISDNEKDFEGLKKLTKVNKKMAIIGDYVFLPYSYINGMDYFNDKDYAICGDDGLYIKKENFTSSIVTIIINYKPRDWFYNEIKEYQEKIVPSIVIHLKEVLPEVFAKIASFENIKKIIEEYSNVGRLALLNTLTPNKGFFSDIHGNKWIYDGETITKKGGYSIMMEGSNHINVLTTTHTIDKESKMVVRIEDDSQVNENTIFVK